MSIKIGDTTIEKIYLGSTEIEKIYQGDTAIYEGDEPTPPTPEYNWVSLDTVTGCSQAVSKMKLEGSASDIMSFRQTSFGQTACMNSNTQWTWDDITNYQTDVNTYEIDFEIEVGYAIYFANAGGYPPRYSLAALKKDAQTYNVTISVVLAE